MDMLARRERLEAEIRAALERRECEAAVIDRVVDDLRSKGYLNDARAVRNAVDYSATERREGPLKTRDRLLTRGAVEDLVAEALEAIPGEQRLEVAVALIDGRRNWKDAAQAGRYLAARGYDEDMIEAALAARFEFQTEIGEG